MPAKQIVILASIGAGAVILSILSYSYFQFTSGEITKLVTANLQEDTRVESYHLANLIESKVDLIDNNLETLAEAPSILNNDLEDAKNVINNRQAATSEITDRYVWLDREGKTVWSSGFVNEEEYRQYRGTDVSFRPYFTFPRDTGLPYYSATIESLDGIPRLFLAHPILGGDNDNTFEGVVFSAITLQNLGNILQSQTSPELDSALILADANGLIAYSSNGAYIGSKIDIDTISPSSSFDDSNRQLFDKMLQESSENNRLGSYDFVSSAGMSTTVAYAPVEAKGERFLTLYIIVPHQVSAKINPLLQQHNNFVSAIILAIGSTAVGIAIFILSWNRSLQVSVEKKTEELRHANESLTKANEKLGAHDTMQKEFINIAAHELRTPIQPLMAVIELLGDQFADGKDRVDITKAEIEILARNAKRLELLSSNILEVSRIESNALKLQKETIDINEKIRTVLEDSRSFIPNEKKVLIVFEPHREPLFVQADRARMFEVLSNLIRNAIKFIEKEGTITIRVEKNDNGYALVSIKDTGIGIAPDMMPRLFTKFATTSGQGTGLGLFISKSIVEAHGGEIWAENNSDSKGATFSFTLPVASDDNNNLEQSKDQAPQTLYQKLTPSRQ